MQDLHIGERTGRAQHALDSAWQSDLYQTADSYSVANILRNLWPSFANETGEHWRGHSPRQSSMDLNIAANQIAAGSIAIAQLNRKRIGRSVVADGNYRADL
jgi:hypothetical protein